MDSMEAVFNEMLEGQLRRILREEWDTPEKKHTHTEMAEPMRAMRRAYQNGFEAATAEANHETAEQFGRDNPVGGEDKQLPPEANF